MKAEELTETHKRFIELEKEKKEVKKFYEELKEVTEGTFVPFKKFDVHRTRIDEEKTGSLSLTEARAQGFEIENK